MNPWILLAIIGMFIHSWQAGAGMVTGLIICYLASGKDGRDSIKAKLSTWGWKITD